MASFTFNQAAGTQLPTIDANWTIDDTGTGRVFETKGSSYLDASANFLNCFARFVNGHGAAQSSKITIQAGASNADACRVSIQQQGSGTAGYDFFLTSSGNWQFRRNNVFVSNGTHSENDTSANFTMEISIDGSGNYTGKINGNTYVSGTDGTPLTGGYPGFVGHDGGSTSSIRILDWTDGVAGGPTINTEPADQTVYEGNAATFSVSATTSGGTLHYQWKDDGSNVGTDSASYGPTPVPSDSMSFIRCDVSDDNGTTSTRSAVLRVIPTAHIAWLRT